MSAQAIPIPQAPAGQAPDRNLSQALLRGDVEEIRVDLQAVRAALHAVATADAAELDDALAAARRMLARHPGDAYVARRARRDRAAVLGWLAHNPLALVERRPDGATVSGLADERAGCVYRTAHGFGTVWRIAVAVLAPVVAGALLWLAFWLVDAAGVQGLPAMDSGGLLLLYASVLAGASVHMGLLPKTVRFDVPLAADAPGRTALWLSLRWVAVTRLMVPILAVTAGLWLAGVTMDGVQDFATAALAGYGADSLWSKGIDKFTQKAAAAVANQ